jgi:serine/threonine protein kinase
MTGEPLFCVPSYGEESYEDDHHLLTMYTAIGPFPDDLYKHWKTSSHYFIPDRKLYNHQLGGVPEGGEPLILDDPTMEEAFDRTKTELEEGEARQIKALIRRILQYDSEKRLSPAEILQDPWFLGS